MIESTLDYNLEPDEERFEIAQKRTRVISFFIDLLIFYTVFIFMAYFTGSFSFTNGAIINVTGFPALIVIAFGFFIWPVCEGIWGQTIGKKLMRIEVVNEQYKPISMGQAFVRFILGMVDLIFLVGLIVASNNDKNQRIGDLVANTIVVKEHQHVVGQ